MSWFSCSDVNCYHNKSNIGGTETPSYSAHAKSNTSLGWLGRNKHLLKWLQHRKHYWHKLQVWHHEYGIYAKFETIKLWKNRANLLRNLWCDVNILIYSNLVRSLNHTRESVLNALGTRNIYIRIFKLTESFATEINLLSHMHNRYSFEQMYWFRLFGLTTTIFYGYIK